MLLKNTLAFITLMTGLFLLIAGLYFKPTGQIHESVLIAFGEACTFAGTLLGVITIPKNLTKKFRKNNNIKIKGNDDN